MLGQQAFQMRDKILMLHLDWRHVYRQRQGDPTSLPIRQDAASLFQYPVTQRHNHPELFSQWNDVCRQGKAAVVLLPTK
ncbi:hypothetical protein D3C76_1834820 [compost metagenome]